MPELVQRSGETVPADGGGLRAAGVPVGADERPRCGRCGPAVLTRGAPCRRPCRARCAGQSSALSGGGASAPEKSSRPGGSGSAGPGPRAGSGVCEPQGSAGGWRGRALTSKRGQLAGGGISSLSECTQQEPTPDGRSESESRYDVREQLPPSPVPFTCRLVTLPVRAPCAAPLS